MGFYEPTFTNAVYEFYDELNNSLTGKIIVSTPGVLENPTITTGAGLSSREIENPIATNNVSVSPGTASPGCELDYSCYDPFALSIGVGQKVTWKTSDVYYHTVTSGSPTGGPDGMFDSGLFGEGETFSYRFNEQGKYDYFCLVHPWMSGIIIVEGEDN
jgi:plastocyanin